MEEYEKLQKKLNGLTILVMLLVVLVLGLGGYVVYDKVLTDKPETKEEKETEVHVNEVENELKKESITIDKKKVNTRLGKLTDILYFALEDQRKPENITYDVDLLANDMIRFDFAWASAHFNHVEKYIYDVDADGEEVTGAYAIETESFKNYYKKLYGIDWNGKYSKKYDFKEKDGYIYGGFYTGWSSDLLVVKTNEMYKYGEKYYLVLDVLYSEEVDSLFEVDNDEVIDYDQSLVSYKLELELEKNNDEYVLKAMKAIK